VLFVSITANESQMYHTRAALSRPSLGVSIARM
jgi:hypothetical protein